MDGEEGNMKEYDRFDLEDEFGDDLDDIALEIQILRNSEASYKKALLHACGGDAVGVKRYLEQA